MVSRKSASREENSAGRPMRGGRAAQRGRGGRGARGGRGGPRARQPRAEDQHEHVAHDNSSFFVTGNDGKQKQWWRSTELQPCIVERNLQLIPGARHARRPSAIARRENKRHSTDVMQADEFAGSQDSWQADECMPAEAHPEDVGWCPGPVPRERPPFNGPRVGPTNERLHANSPEVEIMNELLTVEFKSKCQVFTRQHVEAYRLDHPEALVAGSIEKAFGKQEEVFLSDTDAGKKRFAQLFDVWVAAKLRVAQLKPEIPACALWGKSKEAQSLYDCQLDGALTWVQFQWCNRHLSFADAADDALEEDVTNEQTHQGAPRTTMLAGEDEYTVRKRADTYRKRRALTDIANQQMGKAFNPGQHLGLDEATRATKHWEKMRIRFKAAVHSGTLVDMLNDCQSNYCLWFEEQTWHSKVLEGDDVNTVDKRLERAAQCLVDKQFEASGPKGRRSTAGYCISLDRGYGHIAAQRRLWKEDGIYSNSMMQANRVGLPREFIQQVARDLETCPALCNHKPDVDGCRKFMWTSLHKDVFELNLWQDSQLIVSFGNFFSSSRAGLLSRGAHGDKESFSVWAPESIWHYNVEGRSATDSSDQLRKKMAMAERRTQRAGPKGIAFVFDIAFTNGSIIKRFLQPDSMPRCTLDRHYTKVLFCQRWCNAVLQQHEAFRSHTNERLRAASNAFTPQISSSLLRSVSTSCASSGSRSGSSCSSQRIPNGEQHVLIDLYVAAKCERAASTKRKRGRPKASPAPKLRFGRGMCGEYDTAGVFHPCATAGYPGRCTTFCQQCRKYFHLPCFFAKHYSCKMP